ncbi:unnamed protein product [Owenia fusiformis]|uniref:Dihydropteridine reductase n=1 Tax=Owenia fusiformis TaxID=6347 RepID=A0A8S4NPT4_OWEFU|nr:unnamed protein product [Owenia fusiformis]
MAASGNRVLIYGGKGALGSVIVNYFKGKNWWVGSIDLNPNEEAHANIVVKPCESLVAQEEEVSRGVEAALAGEKVDAVLCVAGGWAGGNAAVKEFVKNTDMMMKQSVWTSVIAAHLAAKHLKEGGVLQLTGAQPALKGTPGMIGYGMAKGAVHQLVQSLAADNSGLPANSIVAAILPVTLDTPMNRKWMPDADQTTWTPLETVAELFYNWSTGVDRPSSGALIQLITEAGKTSYVPA